MKGIAGRWLGNGRRKVLGEEKQRGTGEEQEEGTKPQVRVTHLNLFCIMKSISH